MTTGIITDPGSELDTVITLSSRGEMSGTAIRFVNGNTLVVSTEPDRLLGGAWSPDEPFEDE